MFDSDNDLIDQILTEKDRDSANKLISRYYKKIYKHIYMRVSDKEIAMDLTQETFIAVLKGLADFNSEKASFKTWAFRIATNKVIDYSRSRAYHESMATQELADYDEEAKENIEQTIINSMAADHAKAFLQKETEQIQNIFMMKAGQGYTFEEISNILGMTESTVKSKYYAVVKRMRKELKEYE